MTGANSSRGIYVGDTSVYVAIRKYYPRDVPAFEEVWRVLERLVTEARLVSPLEVRDELDVRDDEMAVWVRNQTGLFPFDDSDLVMIVMEILQQFGEDLGDVATTAALRGSRAFEADPWVIGLALLLKRREEGELFPRPVRVVTLERRHRKPDERKVRIPEACGHFDIECVDLFGLLQLEASDA